MQLAPLTARTFEALKRIGYPLAAPPKRCILIEHEGAVICGAELAEAEGRYVLLAGVYLASWVDQDTQDKAIAGLAATVRSYCCITGMPAMAVGVHHTAFTAKGWKQTTWGALFSPFERQPDAPASVSDPPPDLEPPAVKQEAQDEPEERPTIASGPPDMGDDDQRLLRELRSEVPKRVVKRRSRQPE